MSVSRKLVKSARTLASDAAQSEILKRRVKSSKIVVCCSVGSVKFRVACGRAGKKCHCQFRSETTTTHTHTRGGGLRTSSQKKHPT